LLRNLTAPYWTECRIGYRITYDAAQCWANLPIPLVAATVPQITYTNGEARSCAYLSPIGYRIGHYPTLEDEFWLVHGIIKTYPLREGLDQVLFIPFLPVLWIRICFWASQIR
jgi:hypothetical protein